MGYFNVHPNKALHTLIEREVEKALIEGNAERLKEFVKIPGLWDVVEDVMDRLKVEWAKQPQQIGLAVIPLASVPETLPHLLSLMVNALMEAKEGWDRFGERSSEGIELLLDRIEGRKREEIIRHLLNSLSEVKPPKDILSDWVEGVFRFVRVVSKLGLESELESFMVSGEASDYLEVVRTLAAKNDEVKPFTKYFVPKISVEEVFRELALGISQRTDRWGDIVNFLLNVPIFANAGTEKWQTVVEPIRQKLENQQTQPEDVKELVKSLIFLIDHAPTEPLSKNLLDSLKNNGHLFHHLYQAHSVSNQEVIAWVLIALTETPVPLHWLPPSWGNASLGFSIYNQALNSPQSYPQVLQEFASICLQRTEKNRKYFNRLIGLKSHERFGSWIRATFQKLAEDIDKSLDFFLPESVLGNYFGLKEILPKEKLNELISALTKKKGLTQEIIERGFDLRLDEIYLSVLGACPEEDWQSYTEFLRKSLQQVQKDEWARCLKELRPITQLIANLAGRGVLLNLGHQFSDALLEHVNLAFEGLEAGSFSEEFIKVWERLPYAIEESQRKVWGKNLRDEFLSKAPERNSSLFLKLHGDALLELGELEERADELVRRVFKEFLERCDEAELEWMEKAIEKVWERTNEESRRDFVQRLKERIERGAISERAKEILGKVQNKILH